MQNAKKGAHRRAFAREATVMLDVEGERAKRRQKAAGEQFGRGAPKVTVKSPEAKGEARQAVADKLGSAPQKVTQAAAVV
jgi:hypothetical protein